VCIYASVYGRTTYAYKHACASYAYKKQRACDA
jgi:hypothetical protein